MQTSNTFKSIIFFGVTDEKTFSLKSYFSKATFIKVFQTNGLDEVQQIIDMSIKAAIITDNTEALNFIKKSEFNDKKGLFRKYHLDWQLKMDKQEMSNLGLNNKITVIKTKEALDIVEKVELYLFGKVNIFNKGMFVEPKTEINPDEGRNFFTLMELNDAGWKVVLSSHEKEDDVSKIIGKDWETFLTETLAKAHMISQVTEEKMWQKPFYEIIFPHFSVHTGKIHKLSLVHIAIDAKLDDNLKKIKSFLQTIK